MVMFVTLTENESRRVCINASPMADYAYKTFEGGSLNALYL